MPYGDDPDRPSFETIEKSIWRDNDFMIIEVRKFGDDTSRKREFFEAAYDGICPLSKLDRRSRIVQADDAQGR